VWIAGHIHTATAISPTNPAAAIFAKHRSTASKSSVSTVVSRHTALLHAYYGENIAMLPPLCFAKWDRIFYFSGQLGLASPTGFDAGRNAPLHLMSRAMGRDAGLLLVPLGLFLVAKLWREITRAFA
jgi:hypothetical protein